MEGRIGSGDELMLQRKADDVVARRSLDETRRIVLDVLAGQRVDVYLFGSWARDKAGPTSDIDVVDWRRVTKEFRDRVLREGMRWNDTSFRT